MVADDAANDAFIDDGLSTAAAKSPRTTASGCARAPFRLFILPHMIIGIMLPSERSDHEWTRHRRTGCRSSQTRGSAVAIRLDPPSRHDQLALASRPCLDPAAAPSLEQPALG